MKFISTLNYAISQIFLALAILAGIGLLLEAVSTPSRYDLLYASAPQMAQVYAEGTYYAVMSAVCFLFAIVLYLLSNATNGKTQEAIEESSSETTKLLRILIRNQRQPELIEKALSRHRDSSKDSFNESA